MKGDCPEQVGKDPAKDLSLLPTLLLLKYSSASRVSENLSSSFELLKVAKKYQILIFRSP